jgi:hypothetical protein
MKNVTLSFAGFSTDWDSLPDSSKEALAILGYTTRMKNSYAGWKANITHTGKTPATYWTPEEIAEAAREAGLTSWGNDAATADALIAHRLQEELNAILSGIAVSTRGRKPAMSDDEKLLRECKIFVLEGIAKQQNKPLPKRSKPEDKAAFESLLERAFNSTNKLKSGKTFAETVDAEFKARKKNAEKLAGGEEELDWFLEPGAK